VDAERPKFEGEGGGAEIRSCNSRVQFLGVTVPEVFFTSSPSMSRKALNNINQITLLFVEFNKLKSLKIKILGQFYGELVRHF